MLLLLFKKPHHYPIEASHEPSTVRVPQIHAAIELGLDRRAQEVPAE